LAVVGYMGDDAGAYPLQNVNVLTLRGRDIVAVDCFHDPTIHPLFALPPEASA
jgi:hypothetical protein